jgi:hypothetical protein
MERPQGTNVGSAVQKNLEEVIVIEHTETCPVYDNGPCDCGVDEHMTDEQIDFELFEKEAAKD